MSVVIANSKVIVIMKINNMKSIKWLLIGSIIFMSSCKGDDIVINELDENDMRTISIAGPAMNANLLIGDFIDDLAKEDVYIDPEGLLYYLVRQSVDINWDELVRLNDVLRNWVYDLPSAVAPLKAAGSPDFSSQVVLSHRDDVRYDEVSLSGGELRLSLTPPAGADGSIRVEIPGASKDGVPLSVDFTVNSWGVDSPAEIVVPLAGYDITLDSNNDVPYDSHFDVNTYLDLDGVSGGDQIAMNFELRGLQRESAYGYFGEQEAKHLDAEMKFDLFDEIDDLRDNVYVEYFELSIEVNNAIGVPFYVEAKNIRFFQKDEETPDMVLEVEGSGTIVVDYIPAAIDGDPLTPGFAEEIIGSSSNSNITAIGNSFPVSMMVDLYSWSNPQVTSGPASDLINFMKDANMLVADMVVKIPFSLSINNYTRKDTIDFDFNDIIDGSEDEVDHIDKANIYFDFVNGIPLDIVATAWVIDRNGNKIEDLLVDDTRFIEAGSSAAPKKSSFQVGLSASQIKSFKEREAFEIVLQYKLSTAAGGQTVKIKDSDMLKTKISFDAKGTIPN